MQLTQPLLFIIIAVMAGLLVVTLIIMWVASRRHKTALSLQQVVHEQLVRDIQLELKQQLTELRDNRLILETQAQGKEQQLSKNQQIVVMRELSISRLQQQLLEQAAQVASLRTELAQQRETAEDKIKVLEQTRQQLSREFELLANRIFDEKTDRFNKNSKSTLETALNPLREQLKDFKQKVEDVYDKDSKERVTLVAELGHLKQLNLQMSADALNLTNALKGDNKAQGNWGEVILERVLEESGLHKGREYDTQVNLKTDLGGRRNPDVIIRLPENKDIIVDSKVSLVHYERYCNSANEIDRQQALKEHINSVRGHINNLSFKDYEQLEGIRTLDFVFIFIPIESAFMAAFENDSSMYKDAYEKNIIVVGPTTLLATLRTVQSIWRYERQNKNAEVIARQAGAMHDKFVGFIHDLDRISEHLSRASLAHDSAMNKLTEGKGNLVTSTQRLEKLGAKVKKSLPASVQQKADVSRAEQLDYLPEDLIGIDLGSEPEF